MSLLLRFVAVNGVMSRSTKRRTICQHGCPVDVQPAELRLLGTHVSGRAWSFIGQLVGRHLPQFVVNEHDEIFRYRGSK
jgi:hypothetical protein